MTRLHIMNHEHITELRAQLDDGSRIDEYRAAGGPAIDAARLIPTVVEVQPGGPTWVHDEDGTPGPTQDGENSIAAYEWLGRLTHTQASDERLWTTLSHIQCREYTRLRWPVPEDIQKARGEIDRHWFTAAPGRAKLRVNAISRLWWAARLTHAPWTTNRELACFETADAFHFTRVLWRSQQVNFDIVERKYGSSLTLRTCLLDALHAGFERVESPDRLSKAVSKEVNLLVRTRQMDSLGVAAQRRVLGAIVDRCAERIAGGSSPEHATMR